MKTMGFGIAAPYRCVLWASDLCQKVISSPDTAPLAKIGGDGAYSFKELLQGCLQTINFYDSQFLIVVYKVISVNW